MENDGELDLLHVLITEINDVIKLICIPFESTSVPPSFAFESAVASAKSRLAISFSRV